MRRLLLILLAFCLVTSALPVGDATAQFFSFGRPRYLDQQQAPPQQRRPRTLFDMLFGPRQEQPPRGQAPAQAQQPAAPQPPPKPTLPPPKPTIPKAAGATRVAVFGDSMAADVGKALDRFYADDPNIEIIQQAVGQSSFARPDYFDWDKTIADQIAADSFDVAVVMIGINDRQTINADGKSLKSLTDDWNTAYSASLKSFLDRLHAANKPVIWIGLPPMAAPQFSAAMSQISSLQRLAVFAEGDQFVDIYDKFLDENGNYEQSGPDVNGNDALMRRSDGVHFATAGADKVAYYADQAIRLFAHGGAGIAVADPLAGTDAAAMLRPPYQGLGQAKLLQMAGAVVPLTGVPARAGDLVEAARPAGVGSGFDLKQMLDAPTGRADAFGAGIDPAAAQPPPTTPVAAAGALTPAVARP
ncbi:MAG TPA: DUF459 domain-containing protein [Devosia sp.]|nr:DUF459 domain-containing protein [Devosia sp.]